MSTINSDILRKIKKCLALGASSNEGEVSNALRQAQILMTKHGVTQSALAMADIGEGRAKSTACVKPPAWEIELAYMLCRAFACDIIVHRGWFNRATNSNGALAEFVYIGLAHNALTASYAHDVLRRQVTKARAVYLKSWEEEYRDCWGCAPQLKDKMAAGDAFSRGYVSNVERQVTALVIDPEQVAAVQAKKTELLGDNPTTTKTTKRGRDFAAFLAGSDAGSEARLHRPMYGKEEQLKLN